MGASNWETCPRCIIRERERINALQKSVDDAYGVMPREKFAEFEKEVAKAVLDKDDCQTFREDYEIYGASKGVVKVEYSGSCTVCNLSTSFTMEHPFWNNETTGSE